MNFNEQMSEWEAKDLDLSDYDPFDNPPRLGEWPYAKGRYLAVYIGGSGSIPEVVCRGKEPTEQDLQKAMGLAERMSREFVPPYHSRSPIVPAKTVFVLDGGYSVGKYSIIAEYYDGSLVAYSRPHYRTGTWKENEWFSR